MNERAPPETRTDPPPSAVRPSISQAKDANDVRAPPPDKATRRARLANREWHRKITGWLFLNKFIGKLTEDEAQVVFQDTCVRALSTDDWPAEEKPTLSWLFTIAFRTCIDYLRARKRLRNREEPLDDHEYAIEMGEAQEAGHLVRYVEKRVAETPAIATDVAILADYVAGTDAKDIAKKYGIKVGNVYQRKEKALKVLRSSWLRVPAAVAVGCVILFLLIGRPPRDNTVTGAHDHAAPNAPLLPLPPHPDPAELRKDALIFCSVKEYQRCLLDLNHARRLDPAGETDPEVAAARQEAEAKVKVYWDKKEH